MRRTLLLLAMALTLASAYSQQLGSVRVEQDDRIDELIRKQQELFAIDSSMNGFRIHVFMEIGNDALAHAQEEKKRFEEAFPDIPVYLTYSEPYFRLRAGDFRNRVEAQKCLMRIKPVFREAFVTSDAIYQPELFPGERAAAKKEHDL